MFVNAKIFYRGTCPTKEYINSLEKKFAINFMKVELESIKDDVFCYESRHTSYVICPGMPELSSEDSLYFSHINYNIPLDEEWEVTAWPGKHYIKCHKGEYQVLTYKYEFNIFLLLKKLFNSKNKK